MPVLSRRHALGAAAAAAIPAPALAVAGTDAELARRCAAYLVAMDAYNAHPDGYFESAAGKALWDAVLVAEHAALSLPPQGLPGVLTLARTAAALAQPQREGG